MSCFYVVLFLSATVSFKHKTFVRGHVDKNNEKNPENCFFFFLSISLRFDSYYVN